MPEGSERREDEDEGEEAIKNHEDPKNLTQEAVENSASEDVAHLDAQEGKDAESEHRDDASLEQEWERYWSSVDREQDESEETGKGGPDEDVSGRVDSEIHSEASDSAGGQIEEGGEGKDELDKFWDDVDAKHSVEGHSDVNHEREDEEASLEDLRDGVNEHHSESSPVAGEINGPEFDEEPAADNQPETVAFQGESVNNSRAEEESGEFHGEQPGAEKSFPHDDADTPDAPDLEHQDFDNLRNRINNGHDQLDEAENGSRPDSMNAGTEDKVEGKVDSPSDESMSEPRGLSADSDSDVQVESPDGKDGSGLSRREENDGIAENGEHANHEAATAGHKATILRSEVADEGHVPSQGDSETESYFSTTGRELVIWPSSVVRDSRGEKGPGTQLESEERIELERQSSNDLAVNLRAKANDTRGNEGTRTSERVVTQIVERERERLDDREITAEHTDIGTRFVALNHGSGTVRNQAPASLSKETLSTNDSENNGKLNRLDNSKHPILDLERAQPTSNKQPLEGARQSSERQERRAAESDVPLFIARETKGGEANYLSIPKAQLAKFEKNDVLEAKVTRESAPETESRLFTSRSYVEPHVNITHLNPAPGETFHVLSLRKYGESDFVRDFNNQRTEDFRNLTLSNRSDTVVIKVDNNIATIRHPVLSAEGGRVTLQGRLGENRLGTIRITMSSETFQVRLQHARVTYMKANDSKIEAGYVWGQGEFRHRTTQIDAVPIGPRIGKIESKLDNHRLLTIEKSNMSKEEIRAWIDTEGSIDAHGVGAGRGAQLQVTQKNREPLDQFARSLAEMGVKSQIYRDNRGIHNLKVTNTEGVAKVINEVGPFRTPQRTEQVRLLMEKLNAPRAERRRVIERSKKLLDL